MPITLRDWRKSLNIEPHDPFAPNQCHDSAVLAPSRPLRAAFGGGLAASLDGACARRFFRLWKVGTKDWPTRSNKGLLRRLQD